MTEDIETRVDRRILEAQETADKSPPTYLPFERTADGVRITGRFPQGAGAEDKVAAEFVALADIADARVNPLVEAIYRIEDKVVPLGIPLARTYTIDF